MSAMRVRQGAGVGPAWPELPMRWAIGLRNPTPPYVGTRHNAGADAVRAIAQKHGMEFSADKALCSEVAMLGAVGLALPLCWMNESAKAGGPVAKRAGAAGVVVVFHDEIELEPGQARLKYSGGYAGHNGLRSLGGVWGGPGFARVRVGVGRPEDHGSRLGVADWALARPSLDHQIAIGLAIDRIADAFEPMAQGRWEEAAKIIQGQ
jgi:PTH1 family peptidyl-tRNA hydrolase